MQKRLSILVAVTGLGLALAACGSLDVTTVPELTPAALKPVEVAEAYIDALQGPDPDTALDYVCEAEEEVPEQMLVLFNMFSVESLEYTETSREDREAWVHVEGTAQFGFGKPLDIPPIEEIDGPSDEDKELVNDILNALQEEILEQEPLSTPLDLDLRLIQEDGQWVVCIGLFPEEQAVESPQREVSVEDWPEPVVADSPPSSPGSSLPRPAEAISPENAGRVSQLARLGWGEVTGIAYTPDGRRLAVATSAGIGLYDAQTLTLERFTETQAQVEAIAFAPDGATLAAGLADYTVRLWRVADGALLHTLKGHEGYVQDVTFAPDGSLLASCAWDGTRLWRTSDWSLLHTLAVQQEGAYSVAFSPDGTKLAAGLFSYPDGDSVQLWRVSDGKLLQTLQGHQDTVVSIAFSPDGTTLATGAHDSTVRLWKVTDGTLLHTLWHGDNVQSVAFSPDGLTLATGSSDGQVRLWQVSEGQLQHKFEGNGSQVVGVTFSPDGQTLTSGTHAHWSRGGHGKVQLWRVNDRALLHTLEMDMGKPSSAAFDPTGTLLASAWSGDGAIRLWSVSDGALLHELEYEDTSLYRVAFSPDGQTLTARSEEKVWQWRTSDWTLVGRLGSPDARLDAAMGFATNPDGTLLVSWSVSGSATLWRVVEGQLVRVGRLRGHTSPIENVAFAADGKLLATAANSNYLLGTDDYTVRVWNIAGCVESSPECGTLLHTFALDNKYSDIRGLAFSPDGVLLAAGVGAKIPLWRVWDGTLLHTLTGHQNIVRGVAFAPDGATLASASNDDTVRLWQVSGCAGLLPGGCGTPLHTLDRHAGDVRGVTFSPDGAWLASMSDDGTIRLWGVPGEQ